MEVEWKIRLTVFFPGCSSCCWTKSKHKCYRKKKKETGQDLKWTRMVGNLDQPRWGTFIISLSQTGEVSNVFLGAFHILAILLFIVKWIFLAVWRRLGWEQAKWEDQQLCSFGVNGSPRPTFPSSTSPICQGAVFFLSFLRLSSFVQLLEERACLLRNYPPLQTQPPRLRFPEVSQKKKSY